MKKEKVKRNIEINISNRLLYTLLILIVIIVFGIGVYAYQGIVPATTGHTMGELMPSCTGWLRGTANTANSWGCTSLPPNCALTNQVLHWDGSVWSCVTIDVGFECYWSGWSPVCDCPVEGYQLCGYDGPYDYYSSQITQKYCVGGYITQEQTIWCCPEINGLCAMV